MSPAGASVSAALNGVSLVSSTVEQVSRSIGTWRNVSIQITNYSDKYILTDPRTYTSSGYCHNPPQPTITGKKQESCSFSKTDYASCGSAGVLTYNILNNRTNHVGELAIMFSVPFSYSLYENWFALGIYEPGISCGDNLFKQMYYRDSGPFRREKGTGSSITYSGKGALVKGTMSAFGQSIIKVELWDEGLAALYSN
ncbi:DELTA-stichotoxin-Hcr4a-like [Colossoma macropomum]|uniref:DELTA-stichotoxin-Hcr4a-like n=1 Tax=Colossoma macropomum TaxID=42526 RepID=UPI001864A79E|nr:DELTA-stichotoxin-Hcr4a-like [Colossoma macropomum]